MTLTQDLIKRLEAGERLKASELATLLNAQGKACDLIYQVADAWRQRTFGNAVHLRGIIEFSNVCKNNCWYCGIRCDNTHVDRYRMELEEILEVARQAKRWGCGTVVLQSGEDLLFLQSS